MKRISDLTNLSNPFTWLDYLYLDECVLPNDPPLHIRARAAFRDSMKDLLFTLVDQDWFKYGILVSDCAERAYQVAREKGLSHADAFRVKNMHFQKASNQYVGMIHNVVHWNRNGKNIAVMSDQMMNLFKHIDLSTARVRDFEFPREMKSVYVALPECDHKIFDTDSGDHTIKGVWVSQCDVGEISQLIIYVWGAPKWVTDPNSTILIDENDDFELKVKRYEDNGYDRYFESSWEDTYLTFPILIKGDHDDPRFPYPKQTFGTFEQFKNIVDLSWEDAINISTFDYFNKLKKQILNNILESDARSVLTEEHISVFDRQFEQYSTNVMEVVKATINMLMYWNQTSSEDFQIHPLEEQRLKRVNDLETSKAKTTKKKKIDTLNRLLERENDKPRWHYMEPKRNTTLESDATRIGRSPRSHIRRGHWRKLRSGKRVLVKPCVVNASKGDTPVNMWKSRLENVK